MIELLAMAQWVTEASDFITTNWTKLLGLLGGTSGVIALLTFLAKLILIKVQSKTNKKNNIPVMDKIIALETQIMAIKDFINTELINITNEQLSRLVAQLDAKLEAIISKSQEIKQRLIEEIVAGKGECEELAKEGEQKAEEIKQEFESTMAEINENVSHETIESEINENVSHETIEEEKEEVHYEDDAIIVTKVYVDEE